MKKSKHKEHQGPKKDRTKKVRLTELAWEEASQDIIKEAVLGTREV